MSIKLLEKSRDSMDSIVQSGDFHKELTFWINRITDLTDEFEYNKEITPPSAARLVAILEFIRNILD